MTVPLLPHGQLSTNGLRKVVGGDDWHRCPMWARQALPLDSSRLGSMTQQAEVAGGFGCEHPISPDSEHKSVENHSA